MTPTLLLGGVLAVVFSVWTATSGWSFALFVVAVWALGYVPGRLLVELIVPRAEAHARLVLSLVLGLISSVMWFWIVARFDMRGLLWIWILATSLAALERLGARGLLKGSPHPAIGSVAATALTLLPYTWIPIYYRNLARQPDGAWNFYPLPDVIYHASISNEIGHTFPPQTPFLPGLPLNYHLGLDMLVAMFAEIPGLAVPDLALRYVPTLTMVLVVASALALGRSWLTSDAAATLFATLMILGEDWSFLPGWAVGSDAAWSVHFFGMPTIVSMYQLNPMLPALGLLCLMLSCLMRYSRGDGRGWGVVACILLVSLAPVKIFTFAHALCALTAAGAIQLFWWRRAHLLQVALGAAILFAPFAISDPGSTSRFWIRIQTWPYIPAAFIRSGLGDTLLGEAAKATFVGTATLTQVTLFICVALPLFLLMAFGSRSLGLSRLLPRRDDPIGPVRMAVALFVIMGPLISLTWAVTARGYPDQSTYNNAVWFMVQSKYLAWILAVEVIRDLWRVGTSFRRSVALAAVVLSLPSSVQYLHHQFRHRDIGSLPSGFSEMIDTLRREAQPGDIVYARPPYGSALITLTGLRSPVFDVFPSSWIAPEELERRVARYAAFWNNWENGTHRDDVLLEQSVRYVLVDHRGSDPALARGDAGLRLVAKNARFTLYAPGKSNRDEPR